jgi:hypothetical protein
LKSKFGGLDVKRIYFGNWLRDYSQVRMSFILKDIIALTILLGC